MKIVFTDNAWEEYLNWQETDKSMFKKINSLIKEIRRDPKSGLGKAEPLKHELAGWLSRRINLEHRLIYKIENNSLIILQCRYHY